MTTAARRGILAIATFVILLAVGATFALVLPEEELRRWAGALEQASFAPVTDAERAERMLQLELYRRAYHHKHGVPLAEIDVALYYVADDLVLRA